jgi:hypothetical protein
MMCPPSLDRSVKERAFCAPNGELGIHIGDADRFLAACRNDGVEVLGWELWVVDHAWGDEFDGPVSAPGSWCGGIPTRNENLPVVFSFGGDADDAERQLASIDLNAEVLPEWLPHIRINFTLAE